MPPNQDSPRRFWPAAFFAAIFVFALPALTILGISAFADRGFTPEVVLPILLIAGVVALLGAIAIVTLTYNRYDLTDPKQPLALPDGSVRAIIALLLILIFAIVALFLFATLNNGQQVTRRLTADQIIALPSETQVISQTENADGSFTVGLSIPPTTVSQDFAKQLLTTISTLVVAISAFYFGTQSTAAAAQALSAGSLGPGLELTSPKSPSPLPGPDEPLAIVLRPSPAESEVSGEIISGRGRLEAKGPALFEFTAEPESKERVFMRFALKLHPEHVVYLELLAPAGQPASAPGVETPETPDSKTPKTPETETPRTPETPEPETPETPKSETPETPKPETPETPETPRSETPETPETSETPVTRSGPPS